MGEYAKRKIDGVEVKIGTCEQMYYLRYEQRNEVEYDFGNYEFNWRIPTPTEDNIPAGEFKYGMLSEGKYVPYELRLISNIPDNISNDIKQYSGKMQLRDERSGLQVVIPCYHGLALPKNTDDVSYSWNGKSDCLYLDFLRNSERELLVGTSCKCCGKKLVWSFSEIEPLISSLWMKLRLLHQCTDYWHEHNDVPCKYGVIDRNRQMEIYNLFGNKWNISINDEIIKEGTWEECRNFFIKNIEIPDDINTMGIDDSNYYYDIKDMKDHYLK